MHRSYHFGHFWNKQLIYKDNCNVFDSTIAHYAVLWNPSSLDGVIYVRRYTFHWYRYSSQQELGFKGILDKAW